MKTISQDQFVNFLSESLPELIASILREDRSAISKGHVSLPQFWALHYLDKHDGMTVNELAHTLNRSKSSTSALIQRLADGELVKRTRNTQDRRIVHLSLTPKGRRMVKQLIQYRKEGIQKTYASLTETERIQQKTLMEKILKNVRGGFALLLLTLSPLTALAQVETNSYTLDESIQIGLKQSITVLNAARGREIADATQKRALAGAFPSINGVADYSLYDPDNLTLSGTRTLGLEATWGIFSGGKTFSALRAAKSYQQLTTYQERGIRESLVRDIALAYFQVQLAQARVAVAEQSVQQLADIEEDARKVYEADLSANFDWLSAKVALANEKPKLIAAQNTLRLAQEQFKNLIYIDDDAFELSDPLEYIPMEITLESALSTALVKRPELQAKSNSILLRNEDVKQKKSAYYPSVDLYFNYNMYNPDPYSFLPGSASSGWQDHWSVGARASLSLFDGGRRSADLSESKLNQAIEEDEYREMTRAVSLEIRTQWLRARDALEAINATDENIELAQQALQIARTRFENDLCTRLEVTQANLELGNARLARSQALYEYMAAVTQLKHAAGMLLEEYEND
ncbi:MAG: TolC family protein [Pontiellaceae bacterium]|nr:TolC family protein [Pontiellaceae bacterium]